MAQKRGENVMDIITKGATGLIKAKTAQKKAQLEMKSKLMLKDIERKSDPMYQIKKTMAQQYQNQMGGGQRGNGQKSYREWATTPRLGYKSGKIVRGTPEDKAIYGEGLRRKKLSEQGGGKWDEEDEAMLMGLGQKLGLEEKEKRPTWKQEQEVESIKAGLKQGKLTLFSVQGIPIPQDIKTRKEAMQAISGKGFDPEMFKEELDTYYPEEMTLPEGITQEQVQKARDAGWKDEEITAYFKGK